MIRLSRVQDRQFAVFGLGISGRAACRSLSASGAHVLCYDENAAIRCEMEKEGGLLCTHPDTWPWKELAGFVPAPGIPHTHMVFDRAIREGVDVAGDVELFARAVADMPARCRPRIVAITGTNGKSTTTALVGHILSGRGLKVHVGGNIGNAVLSLPCPEPDAVYVLELSSFQLDLVRSLSADVAVFLNLSPDHLDRYGSTRAYFDSKRRIFRNSGSGGLCVTGIDDVYGKEIYADLRAGGIHKTVPFSADSVPDRGVFARDRTLYCNLDGEVRRAGSLDGMKALRGLHNYRNIAAAVAVVSHFGVLPEDALACAAGFSGLPHRMEYAGSRGKVVFINDSKATNVGAAVAALESCRCVYWIAGGKTKGQDLTALEGAFSRVRKAYVIGEDTAVFRKLFDGKLDYAVSGDLARAVRQALHDADGGDDPEPVVLLSPACASFDQFANFTERGDTFRNLVQDMTGPDRQNGEPA